MPLDAELGKAMLQLITSRYDDRHWRKKIEKTLSLPQSGVSDSIQQQYSVSNPPPGGCCRTCTALTS